VAAPVMDVVVDEVDVPNTIVNRGVEIGQHQIEESVVWDVYRVLCGALTGSDRPEIWTMLTHPSLRASKSGHDTEDELFRASLYLICAIRAEIAGESMSDYLAEAHALIASAVGLSEVRHW
jgi:hypothetical protein